MTSKVLLFAQEKALDIKGLTYNSAEVKAGYIFFALKGVHHDGNAYIKNAIEQGAVLIVSAQPATQKYQVPFFLSQNIDQDMADAAYETGKPSRAQQSLNSQPSVLRNKMNKAAREKREERFRNVSAVYEDVRDKFGTNDPEKIQQFFTERKE